MFCVSVCSSWKCWLYERMLLLDIPWHFPEIPERWKASVVVPFHPSVSSPIRFPLAAETEKEVTDCMIYKCMWLGLAFGWINAFFMNFLTWWKVIHKFKMLYFEHFFNWLIFKPVPRLPLYTANNEEYMYVEQDHVALAAGSWGIPLCDVMGLAKPSKIQNSFSWCFF